MLNTFLIFLLLIISSIIINYDSCFVIHLRHDYYDSRIIILFINVWYNIYILIVQYLLHTEVTSICIMLVFVCYKFIYQKWCKIFFEKVWNFFNEAVQMLKKFWGLNVLSVLSFS